MQSLVGAWIRSNVKYQRALRTALDQSAVQIHLVASERAVRSNRRVSVSGFRFLNLFFKSDSVNAERQLTILNREN